VNFDPNEPHRQRLDRGVGRPADRPRQPPRVLGEPLRAERARPARAIIYRLDGPFTATVKAEARQPQDGALPGIGGTFIGCAEILMHNPGLQDNDYSNNGTSPKRCANVVTPGVGIEVETTCVPNGSFPGLTPGATTTFAFAFRNNGTTPDYGVHFTIALDDDLEFVGDTAGIVLLNDASGAEVTPLGPDGFRLPAAPSWTRVGNVYTLGPVDDAQSFALAPGDSGVITVTARVKAEVLDGVDLINMVTAEIEGRDGIDEDELDLDDNSDSCGNTVYRADVVITKSMTNGSFPWKTYADGGDDLNVTLEYNNNGHYEAGEVVMTDTLPEGLHFINGTLRGVPEGAVVEYADVNGDWSYEPDFGVDENVRAIRIRYVDGTTLAAPANTSFSQTTEADFAEGDFNATLNSPNGWVTVGPPPDTSILTFIEGVATNSTVNYISSSFYDLVYAMAPERINPSGEPVTMKALSWNLTAGNTTCTNFSLELGYLHPNYVPSPGAQYPSLGGPIDSLFAPDTRTTVFQGDVTFGPTPGFEASRIVFDTPFVFDPSRGPLIVRRAYSSCTASANFAFYTNTTFGNANFSGQIIQTRFEIDQRGGTATGTYTSPPFPGPDEGNVVEWGQVIVTPEFGDENATGAMSIDVLDENGAVIGSYELDDGNTTYSFDLNEIPGFDPTSSTLSLRANFTGDAVGNWGSVPSISRLRTKLSLVRRSPCPTPVCWSAAASPMRSPMASVLGPGKTAYSPTSMPRWTTSGASARRRTRSRRASQRTSGRMVESWVSLGRTPAPRSLCSVSCRPTIRWSRQDAAWGAPTCSSTDSGGTAPNAPCCTPPMRTISWRASPSSSTVYASRRTATACPKAAATTPHSRCRWAMPPARSTRTSAVIGHRAPSLPSCTMESSPRLGRPRLATTTSTSRSARRSSTTRPLGISA
jgi:uncharacterized repeat protein (TIGR01451 family)